MTIKNLISKRLPHLSRFARRNDGYVTLEAMIVLPALVLIFTGCWVYFDVFRQQGVNQKANYVIGDMLSRETDEVDATYIDNSYNLLKVLTRTGDGTYSEEQVSEISTEDAYPTDLRVTVVSYKSANGKYSVEWSEARGDPEPLTDSDVQNYSDRLPVLADGAQVIIVETWDDYYPLFRVGLDAFTIRAYSFTQPRYAPQLLFAGDENGNNGWGNGDQDAPGGSLCNNNAENATDCDNSDGSYNNEPTSGLDS